MAVYFSDTAEQDLVDIYYYIGIENHAPEQADKFLKELRETVIGQLSIFPLSGVLHRDNIRFMVFKRYVITYQVIREDVIIAEIYSQGRNWR